MHHWLDLVNNKLPDKEDRRTHVTPTFPTADSLLRALPPTSARPPRGPRAPLMGAAGVGSKTQDVSDTSGTATARRVCFHCLWTAADGLLVTTAADMFNQSARSPIAALLLSDTSHFTP